MKFNDSRWKWQEVVFASLTVQRLVLTTLRFIFQENLTSIDLATRYQPNSGIKNIAKITKTMSKASAFSYQSRVLFSNQGLFANKQKLLGWVVNTSLSCQS